MKQASNPTSSHAQPTRLLFRCDASSAIGTGHVRRCLTLAYALHKHGCQVLFVCREHPGHLCDLLAAEGFEVTRLPLNPDASNPSPPTEQTTSSPTVAHAAWLGTTWQDDADQTRDAIAQWGHTPDWLIVDHYALDHRWQKALRPVCKQLMVLDDLADRSHACDLLLDQNLFVDLHTRYQDKVPARCRLLLGPTFALLQPQYATLHRQVTPREGPIRRILVFFGGADSDDLTGRCVRAFVGLQRSDVQMDIVCSSRSPHHAALHSLSQSHEQLHLHSDLPSLAPLMQQADLALGASGTSSWERLCLGLPALIISLADNQKPVAQGLVHHGLIEWLGHKEEVDQASIAQALERALARGVDPALVRRSLGFVDGKGAMRTCAALLTTPETPLLAREATLADEMLLLRWANDPVTRRNSFSSDPIPLETHQRWFRSRLQRPESCRITIIESTIDQIPLGQVRFEQEESYWELHFSMAPSFRGCRLGAGMLRAAIEFFGQTHDDAVLFGQAKAENIASRRIFEALGFTRQGSEDAAIIQYQRTGNLPLK